jgi:hypothetical protein
VRAGVLRLLSLLPDVTITHGTADGQPALTLTAGAGFLRIDPSRHRSLPHLATAEFRRLHLTEKAAGNCFAPGSYPEAGERQG